MENNRLDQLTSRVARFGLPLVVLVFYAHAALGFDYTADNTFFALETARNIIDGNGFTVPGAFAYTPSPLWIALLSCAGLGGLDYLLAAKVLSLLFACSALLFSYLIAHEVAGDRIVALCAALAVAMQYWLLQVAPSGTPFVFGLALGMASLFFLLRNNYVLAVVFAALCSMVFWQAAALLLVIVVDVLVNSTSRRHALNVALASVVVFCAALLPWLLYAVTHRLDVRAQLLSLSEISAVPAPAAAALLGVAVPAVAGFLVSLRRGERSFVRGHALLFVWMAALGFAGLAAGDTLWLLIVPLLIGYGMAGVLILGRFYKVLRGYTPAFLLTALLLLANQVAFNALSKPEMTRAKSEVGELALVARWLSETVPDSVSVSAEQPGFLEYYAGRRVDRLTENGIPPSRFVVSAAAALPGFVPVYRPHAGGNGSISSGVAVWERGGG